MADMTVPFVCPHCDDDYWVQVDEAPTPGEVEPGFTCPTCQEPTEVRGPFIVVGPV